MSQKLNNACIIGGDGNFGKLIKKHIPKFIEGKTHIIDKHSNKEEIDSYCYNSELIIFSVPIEKNKDIIKEYVNRLTSGKLVIEISSFKNEISHILQSIKADYASIHPMFGPNIENFKGQNIIETHIRDTQKKWETLKNKLKETCRFTITSLAEEEHDKQMAISQSLTHLFAAIFDTLWKDHNMKNNISTPNSKALGKIAENISKQNPNLLKKIQNNRHFKKDIIPYVIKILKDIENGSIDITDLLNGSIDITYLSKK